MNAAIALELSALRSCPFCGGNARLREYAPHGWVLGAYVSCDECGAETRPYVAHAFIEYSQRSFCSTDKLMATRAWNSRPGEATISCPKCGVAVPHKHGVYEDAKGHKKVLVILLDAAAPTLADLVKEHWKDVLAD